MRTNIELDDDLVAEAMKLSGAKTKREVVEMGLQELIRRKQRKDLSELAGKIEFYEGFDYKAQRRGRYDPD